jgi:hypothetical protein
MSFADHIRRCNDYDPARVVPLLAGDRRIGLLRRDNAAALRPFGKVFAVEEECVRLVAEGDGDTLSKTGRRCRRGARRRSPDPEMAQRNL